MHYIGTILRGTKRLISLVWEHKRRIVRWGTVAFLGGLLLVVFLFIYYSKDLPSPDTISELFVPESTKIYDRTGTVVLYDIYGEEKRTVVGYEDMPDYVRQATIVAEDDNFYHHAGLDVMGIGRALLKNISSGEIEQGGSTITQQFVKNAFLTPERTITRKIKEAILAIELEWKYSKDEILTFYLNQVPYGSNAYGIEAASKTYFDKPASELTLAEATTLAALPQAPTYYTNNPEALKARQNNILNRMVSLGYVNEEQKNEVLEQSVEIRAQLSSLQAPHFVLEIKERLEKKYGASYVEQAGLRVVTTLDTTIQKAAEDAVEQYASRNLTNYNSHNASLVAIDPKTGHVLAMVGSKDYSADPSPQGCVPGVSCRFDPNVNVATTPQQPGSSFKPFAYAKAFQKGYTPDTLVFDVPTEFNTACSYTATQNFAENGARCYNPQNYDLSFRGPISLKEALAQSRNIPAVKTLYLAGIDETLKLAKEMGIESLGDGSRYGLSLVLGGGDVTLLEEVSAFGVFAARGEKNPHTMVLRVEAADGTVLEEYRKQTKRVLEEEVADQISYVLSTNEFRIPSFGVQNHLTVSGLPVAAKTGTTQDYRDAWTVGYTPSLAVGVWTGNNNNAPMYRAPGSSVAAPIFNAFLRSAYDEKQADPELMKEQEFYFSLPSRTEEKPFPSVSISETGKSMLDGVLEGAHSILHHVSKNNPLGDTPENPEDDPQYLNWENAVRRWAGEHSVSFKETEKDAGENENISVNFSQPQRRTFSRSENAFFEANIRADDPIKRVVFYLGRDIVEEREYDGNNKNIRFQKTLSLSSLKIKPHAVTVEVFTESGEVKQAFLVFKIE